MAVFLLTAATPGAPSTHPPPTHQALGMPASSRTGGRSAAPKARAAATLTRDDSKDFQPTRQPQTQSLLSAPALNNGPQSRLTTSDRRGGARPLARAGYIYQPIGWHCCRSRGPALCVPIGSSQLHGVNPWKSQSLHIWEEQLRSEM